MVLAVIGIGLSGQKTEGQDDEDGGLHGCWEMFGEAGGCCCGSVL
jgi:hypothetical protein